MPDKWYPLCGIRRILKFWHIIHINVPVIHNLLMNPQLEGIKDTWRQKIEALCTGKSKSDRNGSGNKV